MEGNGFATKRASVRYGTRRSLLVSRWGLNPTLSSVALNFNRFFT